jgi:hypothetical protein
MQSGKIAYTENLGSRWLSLATMPILALYPIFAITFASVALALPNGHAEFYYI